MRVRRIHHLTMAVTDVEAARQTFAELFGAAAGPIDTQPAFGVRGTELALGEDRLQVVAPLGNDSAVQRYLERRGEGFYTLALEVDDVDAAVRELHSRGIRVSEPVDTEGGVRTAFVTMAATHGLSIQLVQPGDARAERTAIVPPAVSTAATTDVTPEPEQSEAATAPLDLTPDEWSDVE